MSKYQHSGRTDQTKAALKRLIDARSLQSQSRWRGAMYLAGYSIECKLKARLMEMNKLDNLEQLDDVITQRVGHSINVFTHSIEVLFGLTGARERLLHNKASGDLRSYQICNNWKPAWRYKPDDGSEDDCKSFINAVENFGRFIENNI